MARASSATPLDQAEPPTSSARLTITLRPIEGTADAHVPPDQAHHLITTFGLMGSAFTGTGAAVLTLNIAHGLTVPALAELGLALAVAVLIAASSRVPARKSRRGKTPAEQAHPAGKSSS
jgi:hypothetical protein